MIEIPKRHLSGKNSADIRLAVDAMDLCWSKEHLDTFVILSGDSDFSPLVAKLRENNKSVIAIGVRESSSALLIENCDEFIFYEDLAQERARAADPAHGRAQEQGAGLRLPARTIQALIRENKEVLYGSMVKDTLKRKHPSFTESSYGYSSLRRSARGRARPGDRRDRAQPEGRRHLGRDRDHGRAGEAGAGSATGGGQQAARRERAALDEPAAAAGRRAAHGGAAVGRRPRRGSRRGCARLARAQTFSSLARAAYT